MLGLVAHYGAPNLPIIYFLFGTLCYSLRTLFVCHLTEDTTSAPTTSISTTITSRPDANHM
jgi:hypothetical protein